MRRVLAFVAGFMLAGCSATGGNLISLDANADVSRGATDAHADRSMADESESGPDLPDGSRSDSTTDRAGDTNDAVVDVPALASDASSETADWLCPGHREPCLAGDCNPSITIKVGVGSSSITSVRALDGGCMIDKISTAFGGDVREVDGGVQALPAVVVFVDSSCVPATDCDFEVSFAGGATTVITSNYSQSPPIPTRFCIDNSDCCPPSRYVEEVGYRCDFWPSDFVVDVPVGTGGGVLPMDSGLAGVDGNIAGG